MIQAEKIFADVAFQATKKNVMLTHTELEGIIERAGLTSLGFTWKSQAGNSLELFTSRKSGNFTIAVTFPTGRSVLISADKGTFGYAPHREVDRIAPCFTPGKCEV